MFKSGLKQTKEENDKILVQLVFNNPCLYIPYVQQVSHHGIVENTWAIITRNLTEFGIPIPDPRKRWGQLKKSFNNHYKKRNTGWYLYQAMLFTVPYSKMAKGGNTFTPSTVSRLQQQQQHFQLSVPDVDMCDTSRSSWGNSSDLSNGMETSPRSYASTSRASTSSDVEVNERQNSLRNENTIKKEEPYDDYELLDFDEVITIDDDDSDDISSFTMDLAAFQPYESLPATSSTISNTSPESKLPITRPEVSASCSPLPTSLMQPSSSSRMGSPFSANPDRSLTAKLSIIPENRRDVSVPCSPLLTSLNQPSSISRMGLPFSANPDRSLAAGLSMIPENRGEVSVPCSPLPTSLMQPSSSSIMRSPFFNPERSSAVGLSMIPENCREIVAPYSPLPTSLMQPSLISGMGSQVQSSNSLVNSFSDASILGKHPRVQDIPKDDLSKKARVVPPIDRFARRKPKQASNEILNETLQESRQDLKEITSTFTNCMVIQAQVLQNQLKRDREAENQKYVIKTDDALFNLFAHEWDLLEDEKQLQLFSDAIDIMTKYQTRGSN